MANINMTPGIDWTKEDCVLLTSAGVIHAPRDMKELSENFVKVEQQWGGGGYYIYKCDDYLSIKVYQTDNNFCRVRDFQRALNDPEKQIPRLHVISTGHYYPRDCAPEMDREIRVYKDGAIAVVRKVVIEDQPLYYVNTDPYNWGRMVDWGTTLNHPITLQNLDSKYIKVVESDEEIKEAAQRPSLKSVSHARGYLFTDSYDDLTRKYITYPREGYIGRMHKETQQMVEDFFDYMNESYTYKRSQHAKKLGYTNNAPINSLWSILVWCASKEAAAQTSMTKEEHAKYLLSTVMSEWDDPDSHENEAIWTREGDDIILIAPNFNGRNRYSYGYDTKKLFSYNVKTKKRFYGELSSNGVWTFPIPSMKYISQSLHLGLNSVWDAHEHHYISRMPVVRIKNGLTVRELFDGTNIAWILDNTDDECKVLNTDDLTQSEKEAVPYNVKHYLNDNRIGSIALDILISTGNPMLEQLLKSKLFNMYFTALEDWRRKDSCHTDTFWDDDKKYANDYSRRYACFNYHSKQNNLKSMFGFSLPQLREIDKNMCYALVHCQEYSYSEHKNVDIECWQRTMPHFVGLREALGVEPSSIDQATFAKCTALSQVKNNSYYYRWHDSIWLSCGDIVAKTLGADASPKQIVDLIETYHDSIDGYRDYLRMRETLKNMQDNTDRIQNVYSDKKYPIKPKKAERFIPYLAGMTDDRYSWNPQPLTPDGFLKKYTHDLYSDAASRGDIKISRNPETHLLNGIMISMLPIENMRYLHDELSSWINFYQDTAKDELFQGATQRVKPLEWSDEESGLCIIAPTKVSDLTQEGHILCHCVGSYVNAIIDGTENIMFLRRSDMKDSPFYTVEILPDGNLRQVHCYGNGDLTPTGQRRAYATSQYLVYDHDFDIVQFLVKWAKAMKGKVNASSIKSTYGMYCAIR